MQLINSIAMKTVVTGSLILLHVLMLGFMQVPVEKNMNNSFCGNTWSAQTTQQSSTGSPILAEAEYYLSKAGFVQTQLMSSQIIIEESQNQLDLRLHDSLAIYLKSIYSRVHLPEFAVPIEPDLGFNSLPS